MKSIDRTHVYRFVRIRRPSVLLFDKTTLENSCRLGVRRAKDDRRKISLSHVSSLHSLLSARGNVFGSEKKKRTPVYALRTLLLQILHTVWYRCRSSCRPTSTLIIILNYTAVLSYTNEPSLNWLAELKFWITVIGAVETLEFNFDFVSYRVKLFAFLAV